MRTRFPFLFLALLLSNCTLGPDFAPPKPDGSEYPYGHDPHHMVQSPSRPDRLWHQNHCGIYKIDRPSERWQRVGSWDLPATHTVTIASGTGFAARRFVLAKNRLSGKN